MPSSKRPALRVLLADDSPDVTAWMNVLLRRRGYDVRTVSNGIHTLEVGEEWRPDVFLLDIRMPGLDGLEVARKIRTKKWGRKVVLIAITGRSAPDDVVEARKAGFDHHLLKPVQVEDLCMLLAGVAAPPSKNPTIPPWRR